MLTPEKRPPGLPPGTLVAHSDAHPTSWKMIEFDGASLEEIELGTHVDSLPPDVPGSTRWIDITGLQDIELLGALGERLHIHPLILEDVVNLDQRPKVESFGEDEDLFIVARMVTPGDGAELRSEQVGIFLRGGLVVTFQERPGDCFEPIRQRLRKGRSRIRNRGAGYLGYALLDAIVDGYMPVLDRYGDILEDLEEQILEKAEEKTLRSLHRIRRDLIALRRMAVPMRETVHSLLRNSENESMFDEDTLVFVRDCYDHAIRTLEQIEGHRELVASLMDLHLSAVSNHTNEVMKVLTMIATIFIPLSFLAGLYGMNFDTTSPWNLPELTSPYGYPILLGVMAGIATALLGYFRRKGWL